MHNKFQIQNICMINICKWRKNHLFDLLNTSLVRMAYNYRAPLSSPPPYIKHLWYRFFLPESWDETGLGFKFSQDRDKTFGHRYRFPGNSRKIWEKIETRLNSTGKKYLERSLKREKNCDFSWNIIVSSRALFVCLWISVCVVNIVIVLAQVINAFADANFSCLFTYCGGVFLSFNCVPISW